MSQAPARSAAPAPSAADASARAAAAARNAAARADEAAAPVAERTVYFGFDQYTISPSDADLLSRHARYLATVPNTPVRIEGHADERGSAEYNLALGQRRADAVRRTLSTLGVRESMIESVSWGEQKPAVQGSGEDVWARNRRAEIIYSAR
ncbi:peptidoglycan-associated lipoprotein Pal [Piscinibacter sakaiensis]|uniref:peptidoglycan-associated lipoprotein Pal n=1 Tax=Piscinibacter sakaiensis TaxID=1547922 RepID=UPI003AB0C008